MAEVTSTFQKLLEQMQALSANIHSYIQNMANHRPWMHPPASTGQPLEIEDIKTGFDRSEANENYGDAVNSNNGQMTDCMTSKVQIDYMSVMERAYRHRQMTPIRAMMHAAGRRRAHGTAAGVHVGGVVQYVQDLAKTGQPPNS